jgi:hemerythrin-like domain-containing protein
MKAIERLRRDHRILRAKLAVLESALQMGPETWFVLREVCFTLARQLRDHIRREEALVAECRNALNPKVLAEVVVEHKDEPQHLRTINRLFTSEPTQSLERIGPELTSVIDGLRRHMDEEERELFPIFERALAEREAEEPAAPAGRLDETMTVNRIVHEFPRTRLVFEKLFINIPTEGCGCLDEVAWRHGMEARELLENLERAIGACACRAGTPREEAVGTP